MMIVKKGGCIIINKNTKQIAIVHRIKQDDYSFPKGHIEKGETVVEGAIREAIEETGNNVKLLKENEIYITKYETPSGENVEVYYYLAEDCGKYDGVINEEDKEICNWYKIKDIEKRLTYSNDIAMWKEIKSLVESEIKKKP